MIHQRLIVILTMLMAIMIVSPQAGVARSETSGEANLDAVKAYVVDQAQQQKAATEELRASAEQYFETAQTANFDYQAMWETDSEGLSDLLGNVKSQWLEASTHYELNEGLIAGVPSLSYYDVWLDAGPSGTEDPQNALEWTLELPDGRKLENPGNFFHNLTEPLIWGTDPDFVGLQVDFDGNGKQELGEVMPEANIFIATAQGLDDATGEMQSAIDEWEPTVEDAFGALITMVPTMNEYFEQWKNSTFVTGERSTEASFVATSRLFDVNGIVHGLTLTYDEIGPLVENIDPILHEQIEAGFDDLVQMVGTLYQQEADGKQFTPEEADLQGSEAQAKADRLAGLVSQAVAILELQV